MKPLQFLRAWWLERAFRVRAWYPGYLFDVGVSLSREPGWTEQDAVWLLDHDDRLSRWSLNVTLWWTVQLEWRGGIEPEPLSPVQLSFRRTRRAERRGIVVWSILALAIMRWAVLNALAWWDGTQGRVSAGLYTGAAFVGLCICAAGIAECVDQLHRSRERERVAMKPQTPAR